MHSKKRFKSRSIFVEVTINIWNQEEVPVVCTHTLKAALRCLLCVATCSQEQSVWSSYHYITLWKTSNCSINGYLILEFHVALLLLKQHRGIWTEYKMEGRGPTQDIHFLLPTRVWARSTKPIRYQLHDCKGLCIFLDVLFAQMPRSEKATAK